MEIIHNVGGVVCLVTTENLSVNQHFWNYCRVVGHSSFFQEKLFKDFEPCF